MQYLLTKEEYENLVPAEKVAERNKALAAARQLIVSDSQCEEIDYCEDCPIGRLWRQHENKGEDDGYEEMMLICTKRKKYPK